MLLFSSRSRDTQQQTTTNNATCLFVRSARFAPVFLVYYIFIYYFILIYFVLDSFRAEDFVTGLASLNRITAQMGRLRSEDRRKILFGSDQIVP